MSAESLLREALRDLRAAEAACVQPTASVGEKIEAALDHLAAVRGLVRMESAQLRRGTIARSNLDTALGLLAAGKNA